MRTQRLQLAQPIFTRDTITQFTNFRIRKKRFLTNAHHLSPVLMRIHILMMPGFCSLEGDFFASQNCRKNKVIRTRGKYLVELVTKRLRPVTAP